LYSNEGYKVHCQPITKFFIRYTPSHKVSFPKFK
jgi:hypothetical protein